LEGISHQQHFDDLVEGLSASVRCWQLKEVKSQDFSFLIPEIGDYHFLVDSPFQTRKTQNEITVSYTGYKIKGSMIGLVPIREEEVESAISHQPFSPVIIHKEVVKEVIVKIPCKYCSHLNEQTLQRCAFCGAPLGR